LKFVAFKLNLPFGTTPWLRPSSHTTQVSRFGDETTRNDCDISLVYNPINIATLMLLIYYITSSLKFLFVITDFPQFLYLISFPILQNTPISRSFVAVCNNYLGFGFFLSLVLNNMIHLLFISFDWSSDTLYFIL